MRVAQSLHKNAEALKGIQDFADQEKNVEDTREPLPQQTPELSRGAQLEREKQEHMDDFRYRYGRPAERLPDTPPQHTRGEESEQEQQRYPDTIATVPQHPEQELPSHHPRTEELERKRQLYDAPEREFDAAKQKRQAHRLARDPERQNRRCQDASKKAEDRERILHRIEQTPHPSPPEPPKPERHHGYRGKYEIAEQRHHNRERRYGRSRDDRVSKLPVT